MVETPRLGLRSLVSLFASDVVVEKLDDCVCGKAWAWLSSDGARYSGGNSVASTDALEELRSDRVAMIVCVCVCMLM